MKEKILEIIKNKQTFSLTIHDIKKELHLTKKNINDELQEILSFLEKKELVFCDEYGVYHEFPKTFAVATIKEDIKGNYYAVTKENTYHLLNDKLNGALSDDIVILKKGNKNSCEVIKIIERKHTRIVCEVKIDENGKKYLDPYNIKQNINISLSNKFKVAIGNKKYTKLLEGERILVELTGESYENYYVANYLESLGFKSDPNIDLKCIAISNGFKTSFPKQVISETNKIKTEITRNELENRTDLRGIDTVTIDGIHTKDIDDSIYVKKIQNGNFLLIVSIAHVSHYVKYNSNIWQEAKERGNSLYLLDTVIPMLPRELSNGICSLNELEDRLAKSVFIEIDRGGNIVKYEIKDTIISSKKKMTYEALNEYYYNNNLASDYQKFKKLIDDFKTLSDIITKKRLNDGMIDIGSNEIEFSYNEKGDIENAYVNISHQAEKIIENFMIYANIAVSHYAVNNNLKFIYRNHLPLNEDKYIKMIKTLKGFENIITKIKNIESPEKIQKLLSEISNHEAYPIISSFVARAMELANYETENKGHFGVGTDFYTHYTSPIRRIADLTILMILDYYKNLNETNMEEFDRLSLELEEICDIANTKERKAQKAEYEANKLGMVMLYEDRIGEKLEVYITEIKQNKIVVKTKNLIEGIIVLDNVNYTYDKDTNTIFLNDLKKTLTIGSKIKVNLVEVSNEYRELFFEFNYYYRIKERVKILNKYIY